MSQKYVTDYKSIWQDYIARVASNHAEMYHWSFFIYSCMLHDIQQLVYLRV